MIALLLYLISSVQAAEVPALDDPREVSPVVMGSNRDYFAKLYREAYGTDADQTTYTSCKSEDDGVGHADLYLFRSRLPAAPILVYFNRDEFSIGNIGTVRVRNGEVDMFPGNGLNGTAELQRIAVVPLLAEAFRPVTDVAEVFLIPPVKKCAFAASAYLHRDAIAAP